jgi:hypothetical protein
METIEAYKARIRSYVGEQDPLVLQEAMPFKLKTLLTAATADKLDIRPAAGKWSIREIMAHLADDELVGAYRIRLILSAPGTDIQAFDQALWATSGSYTMMDIDLAYELFTTLRHWNLALFKTLNAEQWKLYGVHAERGIESLEDIASYYAGHDINHLKQMEAILHNQPWAR